MNSFSIEALRQRLEADAGVGGAAARRYCVAFSGGLDSTVLLVAMARLAAGEALGGLRAIHVHHGLHPDAGAGRGTEMGGEIRRSIRASRRPAGDELPAGLVPGPLQCA